jgi:hypothetical protein
MPVLVRLLIGEQPIVKRVRLPEMPLEGDLIELADGTQLIVDSVDNGPAGGDETEVRARLVYV